MTGPVSPRAPAPQRSLLDLIDLIDEDEALEKWLRDAQRAVERMLEAHADETSPRRAAGPESKKTN